MRDDLADVAEIHAFLGVSGCVGWLADETRPDVSCQVLQSPQTLPRSTVAQVCHSSMVVRRVHQHADVGLKFCGGLVGSQSCYICGPTDKLLLKACAAPWCPRAWRFRMSRVPSSLDTRAPPVGAVCLPSQTVDGRQETSQGAVMRSGQVTHSSVSAGSNRARRREQRPRWRRHVRALRHNPSNEPPVQGRCRCLRSPSEKSSTTEKS